MQFTKGFSPRLPKKEGIWPKEGQRVSTTHIEKRATQVKGCKLTTLISQSIHLVNIVSISKI